jgi:4-diphosphocytidyl-2-C-methyl-D-erythritol kinase
MAERVMDELGAKGKVSVEIEKRLPVKGGLGAASSNAVATMVGLERVLKRKLPAAARLRIAGDVGSDLPMFLVGGTTLGVGRGEEVYPLADLPSLPMIVVMPEVGVSTAQAFADWDWLVQRENAAKLRSASTGESARPHTNHAAVLTRIWTGGDARRSIGNDELTRLGASDRLIEVGRVLSAWLSGLPNTGAPAKGGSRAGNLLLDLVRTGIENDFEKVVFPLYPELRDIKGALERAGSRYASLSGSGSTLYGLFRSSADASKTVSRLRRQGLNAVATSTLTRQKYWEKSLVVGR